MVLHISLDRFVDLLLNTLMPEFDFVCSTTSRGRESGRV